MFCYNCGKEIPENALYCPFCGTQVNVKVADDAFLKVEEPEVEIPETVNEEPVKDEPIHEPEPEIVSEAPETDEREVAPHAISSFVWSLVANELVLIPVLGLIFSFIALVKGIKGRHITEINPERYRLKGLLTAALIISVIDVIGSILAPVVWISYFSLFKDLFNGSDIADLFTGFA